MSAVQKAFAMRFGASAVDLDSYNTQKLHSRLIAPPNSNNVSQFDHPKRINLLLKHTTHQQHKPT